jgi:hypothetical protein
MSQPQPSGSSPAPPAANRPAATGSSTHEDERGNQWKKKKKKKQFTDGQSGYAGKSDDLKTFVYDVSPGKSGFDSFAKTTREIGEYIARTVKDAGEFRTAMDPENLGFAPLIPPADLANADATNLMAVERWKLNYKTYHDAQERRSKARIGDSLAPSRSAASLDPCCGVAA